MQTFSEENAWNWKQIITVETKKNLNNKEEKNHLPNCGRLNDLIFFSAISFSFRRFNFLFGDLISNERRFLWIHLI